MKKYINIGLFLGIIFFFGGVKIINLYNKEKFFQKDWINIYGAVQRVLGKNEIENFTLFKTDYEKIVKPRKEVEENRMEQDVSNINQVVTYCEDANISVYYITSILPIADESDLPKGVNDYSHSNVEKLSKYLQEYDIPIINIRDKENIKSINKEDLFYRTDHHWTMETCFSAFQDIIWQLDDELNWKLDANGKYTDLNNYDKIVKKKSFLGSYGVKVGEYYAGMDDFVIYNTKFDSDMVFQSYDAKHKLLTEKRGDFYYSMMDGAIIDDNDYYNKYNAFSNNGYVENRVINNLAENDKKVLLISHSYGRPLTQYLGLCFREVRNLDPQEGRYNDNYLAYIEEYNPDLVLIMTEFEGEILCPIPVE